MDQSTLVDTTFSKTMNMDDSMVTINEAIQLVEDRLASRVSIVFSHDFLQEFPTSAQGYFNEGRSRRSFRWIVDRFYLEATLDEQTDDDEDDEDSSASSRSTENRTQNDQRQHRCIKQMGKLTKVN
jgi:hypothetical protein